MSCFPLQRPVPGATVLMRTAMTIRHAGAINVMRNMGQNRLCHFHHIKLQAWHLLRLPAMLILSIKDEADGTSSSSCLVILAGKHSLQEVSHCSLC